MTGPSAAAARIAALPARGAAGHGGQAQGDGEIRAAFDSGPAPRRAAMSQSARLLVWLPAALAAASGWWLRDCVLLASGAWFALGGFLRRMELDSPQHALIAALRCINAGLGALFGAAVLLMMLALAWLGEWQPANDNPLIAASLLLAAFAIFRNVPRVPGEFQSSGTANSPTTSVLLLVGLATLAAESLGVRLVCCAGVAMTAIALARAGWLLLREDAAFMLRAAE